VYSHFVQILNGFIFSGSLPVLLGAIRLVSLRIAKGNRKYFGLHLLIGGRQVSCIGFTVELYGEGIESATSDMLYCLFIHSNTESMNRLLLRNLSDD
jgi:hypothetical protein